MYISNKSRKEIGALGEKVAQEYLKRRGMRIVEANFARKTGELDIIAREGNTLHFVEVKTILCDRFPSYAKASEGKPLEYDEYDPSINIHELKLKKIARTGEWYVLEKSWEGEWQVDGCLVWLRRYDGKAFVRYLPQLV